MKSVEQQITELTLEWYAVVGRDHHKDRDCHFYIAKEWSYGEPPVYVVQHDGYVWDEVIDRTFATSGDAHRFLLEKLKEMVAKEKESE
jgi:hypothetical protein